MQRMQHMILRKGNISVCRYIRTILAGDLIGFILFWNVFLSPLLDIISIYQQFSILYNLKKQNFGKLPLLFWGSVESIQFDLIDLNYLQRNSSSMSKQVNLFLVSKVFQCAKVKSF